MGVPNVTSFQLDDDKILWIGEMNGCAAQAVAPADRRLVARPLWDERIRGVELIDQDGDSWGSSFVSHRAVR